MNYLQGEKIAKRMEEIIPGGAHTYSKGPDQFPEVSPKVIAKARGAYCWDVDGNRFLDWAMGNRVMILGHADPIVNDAVKRAIDQGSNFTRPGVLEYHLAEYLLSLWPRMDMVKFAKNGSDVTTAAVKLARAATGRKYVVVCEDHPFFAIHDWFIGVTPVNSGVPEEAYLQTLKFKYNEIASLRTLIDEYPQQIAAVILEPVKLEEPKNGFLNELREITRQQGIVLIFDENITGMRFGEKGAHDLFGIYPDLACYGKAIGNGFSCSVLAGKKEIMELGGLTHNKPRVFLLSTTHGSETSGLAATLATMQEFVKRGVKQKIIDTGGQLKRLVREVSQESGTDKFVRVVGFDQNPQLVCTREDGTYWPQLHTLFHQHLIALGILMPWISITDSHGSEEISKTIEAVKAACIQIRKVSADENLVREALIGPPVKPVFRKYNAQ